MGVVLGVAYNMWAWSGGVASVPDLGSEKLATMIHIIMSVHTIKREFIIIGLNFKSYIIILVMYIQ